MTKLNKQPAKYQHVNGFRESITPEQIVAYLNHLLLLDPEAIRTLVDTRVPCSNAFVIHPTVQVSLETVPSAPQSSQEKRSSSKSTTPSPVLQQPVVGLLGILNGLLGADGTGWGGLVATYSTGTDHQPEQLLRFAWHPHGGRVE